MTTWLFVRISPSALTMKPGAGAGDWALAVERGRAGSVDRHDRRLGDVHEPDDRLRLGQAHDLGVGLTRRIARRLTAVVRGESVKATYVPAAEREAERQRRDEDERD